MHDLNHDDDSRAALAAEAAPESGRQGTTNEALGTAGRTMIEKFLPYVVAMLAAATVFWVGTRGDGGSSDDLVTSSRSADSGDSTADGPAADVRSRLADADATDDAATAATSDAATTVAGEAATAAVEPTILVTQPTDSVASLAPIAPATALEPATPTETTVAATAAAPPETASPVASAPPVDTTLAAPVPETVPATAPPAPPATPAPAAAPAPVLTADEMEAWLAERLAAGPVYFATSDGSLLPESLPTLNDVAAFVNASPAGTAFEIAGHTDRRGGTAANQALSESRAQTVVDYLVGIGVVADRLRPVGYGESQPISNDRAVNRRVEVHVIR